MCISGHGFAVLLARGSTRLSSRLQCVVKFVGASLRGLYDMLRGDWKAECRDAKPNKTELALLKQALSLPPSRPLANHHQAQLSKFRYYLAAQPGTLLPFLKAVEWSSAQVCSPRLLFNLTIQKICNTMSLHNLAVQWCAGQVLPVGPHKQHQFCSEPAE